MTTEAKFKYALKDMMLNRQLSDINVTMLCDKCHCHRQTFYYHYQDIYDLLAAIFLNEQIPGLDEAKSISEVLNCFLAYSKASFVFLRSAYNSAASDLVENFFYSKITNNIFRILVKDKNKNLTKETARSVARRFSRLESDEFSYWFKIISITPARFERTMKKFIESSEQTLLPALISLSNGEKRK
jgi:AcrR family transcriptional regulator